jgi:hypothetical protein
VRPRCRAVSRECLPSAHMARGAFVDRREHALTKVLRIGIAPPPGRFALWSSNRKVANHISLRFGRPASGIPAEPEHALLRFFTLHLL